ncbi:17364_t:CDS:2, partial [Cetraspora pellucida]
QTEYFHQKFLKAIIHRNLSFHFVENPYIREFLQELNPSYHLPSHDMVKGHLLTKMFSNHVQDKLNTCLALTDITVSLNRWTDTSKNLIFGFIYLLAKVCIGVTAYKESFRCCLTLSEPECSKYPEIKNVTVKNIIYNRYHFVDNEVLTEVIRPVVDAIGRLESNDSTLADIFKELIHIHQQISHFEILINGFKAHTLLVINNKRETELLYNELINYKNSDPSFDQLNLISSQLLPQKFWGDLTGDVPLLHRFVKKLQTELKKDVPTKSKNKAASESLIQDNKNVNIFFDEEEDELIEDINKKLEVVVIEDENSIIKEFFDIATFERDQEALNDPSLQTSAELANK